jgi:hypothetical protein
MKEFEFLWGLGADFEFSRNNHDYDVSGLCYLASVKQRGDYFQNRILPLWYYSSDKNERYLLLPALLTFDWANRDNERLRIWTLGLLRFQHADPANHDEHDLFLLGIPYYHVEHPERKYSSTGSFWGILWDYEKEEETGFSKFSILKFLYKRVEMNGEVHHTICGIRF